ncbi:L,D-transpeptidase catalytic domain [Variovorax sp. HW608]|uniref:murein L,D-transpeptidase catalytic domain-containing protein n=1 Tax=Variovorax sp. HW608 TaxID=1034889 RepID=UPI00081FAD73|nr:murein L,D-transpeptidase catalytic domain family protein [Variovorax sp. HW608]SCK36577.1 L,D-transpeptidase catalytic domain [Variovorax sp. HW608]
MKRRAVLLAPAATALSMLAACAQRRVHAEEEPKSLMDAAVAQLLAQPSEHPFGAVVDFSRHSAKPRFHVVERSSGQVVQSFIVAHGIGSAAPADDGYAEAFSNLEGSEASSLGLYRTGDTYVSEQLEHGLSMRLHGLSPSNSNAYKRLIVVHAHCPWSRATSASAAARA